jgi:hypothetical protein
MTDKTTATSQLLSLKGLKGYIVFLALLFAGYFYLQLNGIMLYNSTKTEHEGNGNTYGSSHHK